MGERRIDCRLYIGLLCLCTGAFAYGAESAGEARQPVSIPEEPLGLALQTLAQQRGFQIAFVTQDVEHLRTPGAAGLLTIDEALTQLLRGTGLDYRHTGSNGIGIVFAAGAGTRASAGNAPNGVQTASGTGPAMAALAAPAQASHSGARVSRAGAEDRSALATSDPQSVQARLEEVIVTARRGFEELSKTPVAITAITAEQLQQAGVTSPEQLQYLAPGVMMSRDNQGLNLSIRGVTTTDNTTKGEPGINFNTDGVPVSRTEEQALALFDLARVEIVSGPQGTLYGKNSTGGAINVVTNAPGNTEQATITTEVGNDDTRRLLVVGNEPLSDSLAVRLALNANYRDGFLNLQGGNGKDNPDDEGNVTARLSALAHWGSDTSLRLTTELGTINQVGIGQGALALDGTLAGRGTTIGYANPYPGYEHDQFEKTYGQLDSRLGGLHLTLLGSYSHYLTDHRMPSYTYNADANRLLVRDGYDTSYGELRVSNESAGPLQFVAGLNYGYEHIAEDGHAWQYATMPVTGYGLDPDYFSLINLLNSTHHRTASNYAHVSYALTEAWHLTAGVREALDSTGRNGTLAQGAFEPDGTPWPNRLGTVCTGAQDCIGTADNGSAHSSKVTWNLGTDYRFTNTQMAYVAIATGYKAGGFNDINPITQAPTPYGPENMVAYEAGYKLRTEGGLWFTSAFYDYDYAEDQISQNVAVLGNPSEQVLFTRLAPTRLYGWENALRCAASRDDLFELEADFERSRFVHYEAGADLTVSLSGQALDRVPDTVLGAGYTHTWKLSDGSGVEVHLHSRYTSSYYLTDYFNALRFRQAPFTRTDASVGYASGSGRWRTELFVTNIENSVQMTNNAGNYTPGVPLSASASISEPRFYGIRETVAF